VRPLEPPLRRALGWLAVALGFAAAMVWAIGPRPDLAERLGEARFLFEQGAALATAVAAAVAALALTLPDASRLWRWLAGDPRRGLAGHAGAGLRARLGADGPRRAAADAGPGMLLLHRAHWLACRLLVLVLMLRRGAPLRPSWTLGLAALAAAAIGNFALRLFHMQDAAMMVLVWQVGAVALIAGIAALVGRAILRWPGLPA
jgi:hypothetical protein